jgi:hypothetical protein
MAAAAALALGVGVGMIPFVNQHLHWSIWLVVPVSGLILGAGLGWVQFQLLRLTDARLTARGVLVVAVAATAGYVATDVGVYLTLSVADATGRVIPLREAVGFGEYMSFRLSGTTVSRVGGAGSFDMGRAGTTITFLVDLVGAFVGAAGAALSVADGSPYCDRCRRYQAAGTKAERCLGTDLAEANLQWGGLHAIAAAGDYDGLAGAVLGLPPVDSASVAKITVTEFVCPGCRQGTVLGTVRRREENDAWGPVNGLTLRVPSGEGQAPRLDG